jgi:hypothetical protein
VVGRQRREASIRVKGIAIVCLKPITSRDDLYPAIDIALISLHSSFCQVVYSKNAVSRSVLDATPSLQTGESIMRNVERLTSLKSELLDIFMSMEVNEHEQRARSAARRNLRARRGIELHEEIKRLSQHLSELPDDDFLGEDTH